MTNRGSSLSEASNPHSLSVSTAAGSAPGHPLSGSAGQLSQFRPSATGNSVLTGILEEPLGRMSTCSNSEMRSSSVSRPSEYSSAGRGVDGTAGAENSVGEEAKTSDHAPESPVGALDFL
jgi:hypothetical protein